MPPSPRERPPPGPSPRGKGIGASPERDAAARRSLTSSLTSSVPPRPAPGTAIGDGGTNAPATTSKRASAYYESSTNLPRCTPDAEARGSNPRDGAGSSARRSIESFGVTAVGLGLGRGGLGRGGLGVSSFDAAYRDAMRASTESGRSEVDAQTAELLAAQQAQLSELNEQLRSLQSQLGSLRRSDGGGRPSGGADDDGGGGDDDDAFRERSSARAMRSPRFGVGESAGSGFTAASRESGSRFSAASSSGHSKRSSDAATNTVWAAPEAGVKASAGGGMRGTDDQPPSPIEEEREEDEAKAWKYEGDGRKSRAVMTDPWVGARGGAAARAVTAGRARTSTRMSVIRRSVAPRASRADDASSIAPAIDDAAGGDGDGDGDEGAAARDVPPLPPLPRGLATTCAAPLPIATEPPVRARSPATIGLELLTSGDENPGPGLVEGFERDAGADRVDSPGLVPSRNSAFTAVRVSDGGAVDDATGGTFFGGQLRGSGAWFGTSDGGSVRASMGNSSARWSVGSRESVSSLAAQAAAEAAGMLEGSDAPNQQHRLSQSNTGPAFRRFPLFAEGDSMPESPATDDPDETEGDSEVAQGSDDAGRKRAGDAFDRSPPPASTTGGHEDGDEVLRASSDTFSAVSTSQAGSLSLRGGIGGGDRDGSTLHDDDYSDSDFDDAGTAVTGTTTGRADPDGWTPPTRWGVQKMSEAAIYDPAGDDDAPGRLRSPARAPDGGPSLDEFAGARSAEERERIESTAVAEVMPTISYQPLSDDEDSEDDELMKRLLKKYGVSAPKGL